MRQADLVCFVEFSQQSLSLVSILHSFISVPRADVAVEGRLKKTREKQ